MKKTLAILATVAALGAAVTTPAEAHWRGGGWGPGIGFGLVAGALAAGAYGAYGPYGYPSRIMVMGHATVASITRRARITAPAITAGIISRDTMPGDE